MNVIIEDPRGYPDTIANDLTRAEFDGSDDCDIVHLGSENVVEVHAPNDELAERLYQWLEETAQHYRTVYVDASGEYDAARELADAVYEAKSASEPQADENVEDN